MKCNICKNGNYRKGFANSMFDKANSIIIIKNVPAHICDNCGAKIFDEKTTRLLLNKVREMRQNDSEIQVVSLPRKAA